MVGIFLGLLMRKFDDKVNNRLSFSSKYCRAVAEKVFMYHGAMSIFLGSKMSEIWYIFGFSKICCV